MKIAGLSFWEEEREEIASVIDNKDKKLVLELIAGLLLYSFILIHWRFTAWRVEWVWRTAQIAFPILMGFAFRNSLESAGLRFKDWKNGVKLGVLIGGALTIILILPMRRWMPALMPEHFSGVPEFGYALLLISINVIAIELFFRGYLQPRLEILVGSLPGLIVTSVLSGMDFWEFWVFNPGTVIGTSLVFGLLYLKTRSLFSPIIAHITFLTTFMVVNLI